MTDRIYQTDSYVREFEARVTRSVQSGVVLDRSAFYPGGGGQPCDTGHLAAADGRRWEVTKVTTVDGAIVHGVSGDPPPVDSKVHGTLDWKRRYALMRTHTALHILCGVVWRDYSAQVTGGNMEPGRGRLDFEFERMNTELVGEIEEKINHEVEAQRDVYVEILPRAKAFAIPDLIRTKINLLPPHIEQVRVVNIVGLDLQADGGTHVANTREVGRLEVIGHKSKGKINKRIVIGLDA